MNFLLIILSFLSVSIANAKDYSLVSLREFAGRMAPTKDETMGANFRDIQNTNGSIALNDDLIKITIGEEVFKFKGTNLQKSLIGLPVKTETDTVITIYSDVNSSRIIVVIQDGDLEKKLMKLAVFEVIGIEK